jgi:hypothetical protein
MPHVARAPAVLGSAAPDFPLNERGAAANRGGGAVGVQCDHRGGVIVFEEGALLVV